MASIVEVTDSNFKSEIIESDTPAIVDFWAEWCVPCKMMEPVVHEIAKELDGKVKIGKINVDENTKTATDLTVMNIPALVFFKDGREAGRMVGVVSKKDLLNKIKELFYG
jgi:thioredoxin 1